MRADETQPYYLAYDRRYRAAYAQGADRYALPADKEKVRTLIRRYVARFQLVGKTVTEFGCGEGTAALEFARLGCIYQGYDISPAAIEKAATMLSGFPNATVYVGDVVRGQFPKGF
jgi:2-polyprenyl-3-methyl-5-hydroxy-6-metoxy-1,4-benzoquinol methylase